MHTPHHMAGQADDALANAISTSLAKALSQTAYGKPGSPEEASRADFYALVLSKTGEKFLASDQGKKAFNKVLFVGMVPAFVLGVLAGYLWYKRKV